MNSALISTRQARWFVNRLVRDCGIDWPGGADNAALVRDGDELGEPGEWVIRRCDGEPRPVVIGAGALSRMLRDGFGVVGDDSDDGVWRAYHIEDIKVEWL